MGFTRRDFLRASTALLGAATTASSQSRNPNQRGFVLAPTPPAKDITDLAAKRVNLVRYQFNTPADINAWSRDEYTRWIGAEAEWFRNLIPAFQSSGVSVILDLHAFPRETNRVHKLFTSSEWRTTFLDVWDYLANDFASTVYAFDLLNEPTYADVDHSRWVSAAEDAIDRIRSRDANQIVVFQPKRAEPRRFRNLRRLRSRRVLYSLHMYDPMSFTHQGVVMPDGTIPYPTPRDYPSTLEDGRRVDKAYLRSVLTPAQQFAIDNQVGIFVGEFSFNLIASPSSAANYIRDVTSLFEEFNWRWTYHSFREAGYWNPEKAPDVMKILKTRLKKNCPTCPD